MNEPTPPPPEPLYYCPRHGYPAPPAARPLREWATHPSGGYAVCMTCRHQGWNGDLRRVGEEPSA